MKIDCYRLTPEYVSSLLNALRVAYERFEADVKEVEEGSKTPDGNIRKSEQRIVAQLRKQAKEARDLYSAFECNADAGGLVLFEKLLPKFQPERIPNDLDP